MSNASIEFQLYDWFESHDQEEDEDGNEILGDYIINSFGRCDDG